jgi:hypothetical protein
MAALREGRAVKGATEEEAPVATPTASTLAAVLW